MRIAGDGPAGGSSGRRQRPASAEQPGRDSNGGASLFTPAYRVSHGPANALGDIGYPAPESGGTAPYQRGGAEQDHPAWEDSPAVPAYSWSTDDEADPWSVGACQDTAWEVRRDGTPCGASRQGPMTRCRCTPVRSPRGTAQPGARRRTGAQT